MSADRVAILQRLSQAEEHLEKGLRTITRQQEIIQALHSDGHDTAEARRLLSRLEEFQVTYAANRDRILAELMEEEIGRDEP